MQNAKPNNIVISGVGVSTAFGCGKESLASGMYGNGNVFRIMERKGRQNSSSFIGAEIPDSALTESDYKKSFRNASLSAKTAVMTLREAWYDARLDDADPYRIGLIVGGSNLQQRELHLIYDSYKDRSFYVPPSYGLNFMDTDIVGICTELFPVKGFSYTLGGASASGQLAIIQAVQTVLSGQADICIVIGALMDLSYWECQAFRSIGAMGSDRYSNEPEKACRPFDKSRDGFIYGESCGAVVIEKEESANGRPVNKYARIGGWSVTMDGNRNPNPSYDGETYVIKKALETAETKAKEIDYINPHGTGSVIGDETEIKAIIDSGLSSAFINSTKSIVGHGLTAAGTVEVIAALVQMQEGKLHPSRNLVDPISDSCNWVRGNPVKHQIKNAITLSMGFGGINTALILKKF